MSSLTAPRSAPPRSSRSRPWLIFGAASILVFGVFGLVASLRDQEIVVRESGVLGFSLLLLVLMAVLGLVTRGGHRADAIALVLLVVSAMACLTPLVAWLDQLSHPQWPHVLTRQFVIPGLIAMTLGLAGVVGAAVRLGTGRPAGV